MSRDARNAALERAIINNPGDLDSYLVYADWLIEQGDPRGELITAQIAGDRGDAAQRRAAITVFARHRDYFLGPLAETVRADAFDWKCGFIHHARLANDIRVVADGTRAEVSLAAISAALFQHASARFLVKLTLVDSEPSEDELARRGSYGYHQRPLTLQRVAQCIGTHAPPTLRELVVSNEHRYGDYLQLDLAYPGLGNLMDLEVSGRFSLRDIMLPNLRRATLRPTSLTEEQMHDVANARWPRLQSLTIMFGDASEIGVSDLEALLRRVDLSALEHLALIGCPLTNSLMKTIASSPLLARITELDLSDGKLTDQGVRAIAREHDAFRHLELFVVTGNRISESGMDILRGLNPGVIG